MGEREQERARIVWWLRAGVDGPAAVNTSPEYLAAVRDLADVIEHHPERFAEAPVGPQPTFTTRPGLAHDEEGGIVVRVHDEDFLAIYPSTEVDGEWDFGYWDVDSGEWVELMDPDGDLAAQLKALIERGQS